MNELSWTATRADTIDRFHGQTPRPEDETIIIDVFETQPQLVMRAIDETATALDQGKITWAWSVVRSRLVRGQTAIREATGDTTGSKVKAIARARTWIDNAGVHFDRADHVEAELFGDDYARGPLTAYADDATLRADMLEYWQRARPRGEQAEHDHEDWNAKCKSDRTIVDSLRQNMRDTMTAKATHDDTRRAALVPRDADDIDFDAAS